MISPLLRAFFRPSLLVITPIICVVLFALSIVSIYFVERDQSRSDVYNSKIHALSQQLLRMDHILSIATFREDSSRITEEISLVSSDLWMSVYTLIDDQGIIRFANHAVWSESSASLVIDGYSHQLHQQAVLEKASLIQFNRQRKSIQAYYPIAVAMSALSDEQPNLIYLEYDISPALSASDDEVFMRLVRIASIFAVGGGLALILLYIGVLRPIRLLNRQASGLPVATGDFHPMPSRFSEISALGHHLYEFKQRYHIGAKQLKDSEQRWLFAVEVSRYGIWDWNLTDNSLFLSDRWKDMLGYSADTLKGELATWESRLHPEDKASTLELLNQYLLGKSDEFESVHRLRHKQGHYVWVLDRGMAVEWSDKGKPVRMIGTLSDVTEDVRNQRAAQHQTKHDPLTDLANRRALMDVLYGLTHETDYSASLFMVNLDNFKVVNDALGHHGGDRLLIQIAARLSSYFSSNALIARLGADEFVILVKRLPKDPVIAAKRSQAVASQLRQLIARSFSISNHTFNLSACVGTTIINNDEDVEPEQHLKRVSLALAQAKENGRDGCVLYSKEMDKQAEKHLLIRTELNHAIAREQLSLVYQPLIARDGSVASVEALLRWNHPHHGMISPAEFIPIAEGSGLILELGRWVLLEACRFIRTMEMQGIEPPMVSINVSARQFNQLEFAQKLLAVLKGQNVAPNKIELELTEYALLTDIAQVRHSMCLLREAGISIAVDDFGTGYSSLSYLKGLPLNRLKLDASFIRDMADGDASTAIVKSVIDMAHGLDLKFVAEGVEIQSQFEQLLDLQCDLFQGYLFHRPMNGEALKALLLTNCSKTKKEVSATS